MLSGPVKADATGIKNQWHYERHCPEKSLLYQTVERYYPDFLGQLAGQVNTQISATGIRGLPQVWSVGTRIPAGAMRKAGLIDKPISLIHIDAH